MTLDFIRDLEDILKYQGIKFFIVTLRKSKNGARIDMFHDVPDLQTMDIFDGVFEQIQQHFSVVRERALKEQKKIEKQAKSKTKKKKQ